MNLDNLKSSWKRQQVKLADDHFEEVVSRVLARTSWFQKTILRRDLIETAAGIAVIPFLVYFVIWAEAWPWVARLGVAIVVVGLVEGLVVLHWTRWRGRLARHDIPLDDFCTSEIASLDRQIWLLRHVNWWYLGPTVLGCCIFTLGLLSSFQELPTGLFLCALAIFCGFYFAVGWILYRANQRAVRNELQPVRKELVDIYESLRDDSSTDGQSGA